MTRKILTGVISVSLIIMLVCVGLVMGIMYDYMGEKIDEQLKNEAILIDEALEFGGLEYLENVIFISFGLSNLVALRKRLPKQKAQFLVCSFDETVLETLNKYDFDLDISHTSITKELVELVHKNNHIINCWTVNEAKDAEKYAEFGVDQITTENLE